MISKTRLTDAFGELIYAVAIADGMVQPEEIKTLEKLLKGHPWASEIKWSFDYEVKNKNALKETYEKALGTLKEHGPFEDYTYLVEVIEKIAAASDGVDQSENRIISEFQTSLREHFLEFLDENGLLIK
jgi:uncharacterized tellurite resistance protein B-like protein